MDHLDQLTEAPDLIHGQQHLETMTALLHFPGVPAVYVCHGIKPWQETPPRFPRIRRYVAVSPVVQEWLVKERGIPADCVEVVLNFVDLNRFQPRAQLPAHPTRALIFSNFASDETHVPAVREACSRAGIALDIAGLASDNPVAEPHRLLPTYDLVFAYGRAAIEAMAVGAAVVLCETEGWARW